MFPISRALRSTCQAGRLPITCTRSYASNLPRLPDISVRAEVPKIHYNTHSLQLFAKVFLGWGALCCGTYYFGFFEMPDDVVGEYDKRIEKRRGGTLEKIKAIMEEKAGRERD